MSAPLIDLAAQLVKEHDDEILVGAYNALKAFVERKLSERAAAKRILNEADERLKAAEARIDAAVNGKPE